MRSYPDFAQPFVLDCDSYKVSLAAALYPAWENESDGLWLLHPEYIREEVPPAFWETTVFGVEVGHL